MLFIPSYNLKCSFHTLKVHKSPLRPLKVSFQHIFLYHPLQNTCLKFRICIIVPKVLLFLNFKAILYAMVFYTPLFYWLMPATSRKRMRTTRSTELFRTTTTETALICKKSLLKIAIWRLCLVVCLLLLLISSKQRPLASKKTGFTQFRK